jgi:transposase
MKQRVILGVDVSKRTLDFCLKPAGICFQTTNDQAGFKKCLYQLAALGVGKGAELLVVMEHTGQYCFGFERFLRSKSIAYCKIAALQIKRSMGVLRGKNDRIDAQRIAEYGWLRRDQLQADKQTKPQVQQLRELLSLRSKMVKDRAGYMARLKEMLESGCAHSGNSALKIQRQLIKHFSDKIKQLEGEIKEHINSDELLKTNCELLRSIKGVGWIVAAHMLGYTGNFELFSNARKFNCYAGLAPFRHESGSSLRGRSRVSHLANKEAKTLLNLSAFCAIRTDNELKQYYQKRVAEGKNKMSCLNIIRSKLVARMFAVIKRQAVYQQRLTA